MSTYYSPKIVTTDLVLCLDAANNKSYISGSSSWNDLSGRGNHATAYGSVLLSTDGNGCFDFSGATGAGSYASNMGFTFASNMVQTTGNFTFECWIKNPVSAGQTGMFSNAGSTDGYRFGPGYNGIYYLIGPNYTESVISWSSNLVSSLWYHVVTTWDRTSEYRVNAYLNGTYQNYGGMPSTQTAFTSAAPGIVRSSCCGIYTGKLAMMNVYNKLLTASEILQNYNATKTRFAL
jgi:hypothetical protein